MQIVPCVIGRSTWIAPLVPARFHTAQHSEPAAVMARVRPALPPAYTPWEMPASGTDQLTPAGQRASIRRSLGERRGRAAPAACLDTLTRSGAPSPRAKQRKERPRLAAAVTLMELAPSTRRGFSLAGGRLVRARASDHFGSSTSEPAAPAPRRDRLYRWLGIGPQPAVPPVYTATT